MTIPPFTFWGINTVKPYIRLEGFLFLFLVKSKVEFPKMNIYSTNKLCC